MNKKYPNGMNRYKVDGRDVGWVFAGVACIAVTAVFNWYYAVALLAGYFVYLQRHPSF